MATKERISWINSLLGPKAYFSEISKELICVEKPSYNPLTRVVRSTWTFYRRRGRDLEYLAEITFCLKLYSVSEIIEIARKASWEPEAVYGDIYDLEKPFKSIQALNLVLRKRRKT